MDTHQRSSYFPRCNAVQVHFSTKIADINGSGNVAFSDGNEVLVITTVRLMEEVRKYECLYNKQCKEYKDKNQKINSWEAIAKIFNSSGCEVETKFKNTRTAYVGYLKELKSTGSGSRIKDLPLPSEFQNLEWLKNRISIRTTFSDLKSVPANTVGSSYDPNEAEDLEPDDNLTLS